jgi:LysM domain
MKISHYTLIQELAINYISVAKFHLVKANAITDPSALDVGQTLVIPVPCTCFNSPDNFLPPVYLSYLVKDGESVLEISAAYSTTLTDIMNVKALGNPAVHPGIF